MSNRSETHPLVRRRVRNAAHAASYTSGLWHTWQAPWYPLVYLLLVTLAFAAHAQTAPNVAPDPSDFFFGMSHVWEIHIQFEPSEWQSIQPPADIDWDVQKALDGVIRDAMRGRNFHSEKSSRPGLAGYLGIDHQYGRATVTIGSDTVEEVGVRFKGNGTFLTGRDSGKFPFKIDFNEYRADQEFRGMTKVNLSNCATDPSMLREALSYELFRQAGIPAPRTGWAQVYLTVTGEKDREYQGLYELVEQVDKRFLRRHYGSAKGLLIKPVIFGPFRYLGDDWAPYEAAYVPKTTPTPEQQQRLIEFCRLVTSASDSEFNEGIEGYLDVDQFLNFLAVNALLSNLDSFLGGSQNYYAYLEPESHKIQLLPWDLDLSFGAFDMLSSAEARQDLSIDHPQVGEHRLIERVLAIPRYQSNYRGRIEELMEGLFDYEAIATQIDAVAEFLRPVVALEGDEALRRFDDAISTSSSDSHRQSLKYFVEKRRDSVTRQLAGESTGTRVNWGGIPPGLATTLIGVGLAMLVALGLNAGAWLWGVIAGFRGSTLWGCLNLFLYPMTTLAYGFYARKELGRGAAILTSVAVAVLGLVISIAINVLS